MTEWWSQSTSAWIGAVGGGGGGTLVGLFGTVLGVLAPRGIGRVPVLTVHALFIVAGIVTLGLGVTAVFIGQPRHVFYPLLLAGGITSVVMGSLFPVARARYRQAELRRFDAEQFRRS